MSAVTWYVKQSCRVPRLHTCVLGRGGQGEVLGGEKGRSTTDNWLQHPPILMSSLLCTLSPCRVGSLPSDSQHPLTAHHPQPLPGLTSLTPPDTSRLNDITGKVTEEVYPTHLHLNRVKAAPQYLPWHFCSLDHNYCIATVRDLQEPGEV